MQFLSTVHTEALGSIAQVMQVNHLTCIHVMALQRYALSPTVMVKVQVSSFIIS